MPAVIRTIKIVTRTIQARQTVHSFPLFHDPPDDDDDDHDHDVDRDDIFSFDRDELHDGDEHLSEGTIAAIVVSLVVFLIIVAGLLAYLRHRRRRKGKETEVAMKEASAASATAAAASVAPPPGALDPPPPYDEVHGDSAPQPVGELPASEPRSAANVGVGAAAVGLARRREEEEGGEGEGEDDADAIGSHATITDGLAPGRHADAGPGEGGSMAVVMPGKDPEVKTKEVAGKS
ncbi:hypothetical protein VTG60DRAFT_1314 [Thermothelomyces hinnuleus]